MIYSINPSKTAATTTMLNCVLGTVTGIYHETFQIFNSYNFQVYVNSNEATIVQPEVIVGSSGSHKKARTSSRKRRDATSTGDFQRQSAGGSFVTLNYTSSKYKTTL